MRLAVAGGTGAVGREVVAAARDAGHTTVSLSRSQGVDLTSETGLRRLLDGADAVIDVTSRTTTSTKSAAEFFETVTRRLHAAEIDLGIRHHLALSIVGIDRAPAGYYAAKLHHEKVVTGSTVPWTLLRATQFHEFAEQTVQRFGFGPLVVAPRLRSQTVAAREVAERLVDLACGEPVGRATDLAGPEAAWMAGSVRAVLRHRGSRRRVVELSIPGRLGRAMRDGALLPGSGAELGRITFAAWLAERPRSV